MRSILPRYLRTMVCFSIGRKQQYLHSMRQGTARSFMREHKPDKNGTRVLAMRNMCSLQSEKQTSPLPRSVVKNRTPSLRTILRRKQKNFMTPGHDFVLSQQKGADVFRPPPSAYHLPRCSPSSRSPYNRFVSATCLSLSRVALVANTRFGGFLFPDVAMGG